MKQNFLAQLQKEAKLQKKLHQRRMFPSKFDAVTSFIGNYSWQVILFLAVISALFFRLV